MGHQLTNKQQVFVSEYLVDLCATKAAIRAGYSKKSAKEIGHENLTKPHIEAAITKAMESRSRATAVRADRVLKEISEIAFAQPDGNIRPMDKLKGLDMLCRHLGMYNENQVESKEVFSITLDLGDGRGPKQVGNYVEENGSQAAD